MKRAALLVAVLLIAGCSGEPTTPTRFKPNVPVFTILGSSAGGVSFASGSGCSVVLSHLECNYTVENVPGAFTIQERGSWTYTYECLHKKTGKTSARYPVTSGQTSATNLFTATVVNGQIVGSNVTLAPVAPTDCAANKGAYTVTRMASSFVPNSWSLYAYSNSDPNNFYAEIHETL
jgi:hypothetical protein